MVRTAEEAERSPRGEDASEPAHQAGVGEGAAAPQGTERGQRARRRGERATTEAPRGGDRRLPRTRGRDARTPEDPNRIESDQAEVSVFPEDRRLQVPRNLLPEPRETGRQPSHPHPELLRPLQSRTDGDRTRRLFAGVREPRDVFALQGVLLRRAPGDGKVRKDQAVQGVLQSRGSSEGQRLRRVQCDERGAEEFSDFQRTLVRREAAQRGVLQHRVVEGRDLWVAWQEEVSQGKRL